MVFLERAPHPTLAPWLQCLWLFEAGTAEAVPGDDTGLQRIVPDGHPELIFHYGDPYREAGRGEQARIVFAGQIAQPLLLQPGAFAGVVGVRFQPAAARALFGLSMAECTDRRLDASALWGTAGALLLDQLQATPDAAARLDAVEAFVHQRLRASRSRPHAAVTRCVQRLQAAGRVTIDQLTAEAGCSGRQLERLFLAEVGVPPRLLASILRFRRLFDALDGAPATAGAAAGWAGAAAEAGYFDQAHMIRDFKRFAGQSPLAFQRSLDGLGAAMIHGAVHSL